MSVSLRSSAEVQEDLRIRFRKRRLTLDLTQEGLAKRSGVALPTLRRFERTGQIAFESLLSLALVLECLGDFDQIAAEDDKALIGRSLDSVLAQKRGRRKGRIT